MHWRLAEYSRTGLPGAGQGGASQTQKAFEYLYALVEGQKVEEAELRG